MMPILKTRQQSILGAAVREYVRTARPVASQDIADRHGLDVGPATVRNEMATLDEFGYLEQPHTSAGRIPTDKGYRFFVDHLLDDTRHPTSQELARIKTLFRESDGEEVFVKEFSRMVSEMTGTFTATGLFEDDTFYDAGLSQIFKEPEFRDDAYLESFGRLVDLLDDAVRDLCEAKPVTSERVFIGKENPLVEAHDYTMLVSSWKHPAGFEGFVTVVGPKRMDYQRIISVLRCMQEF